ncbi:diacylglycerol/lipid kinase family protein [Aequorivita lipolytica]|uniref:Diacylglycerol kinase n=1 Tax=Aequorivita lipolytica TaxID=153267 RepID=A0A5C6YMQ4_9FLAO|nr:diacylglycerol kinase family protein [Aequorivita lipolytica]TXD68563.1 diacylglycerol kinase [Aequorivita lipolytica]SRX53287.1 putative lipid kinase YegS [Aequorivita lipolytica]
MNSENNILLVVNPISGDSEKSTIITPIIAEAENRNFNLKIYETSGEKDKEAIDSIIKDIKPSRILVAGGDGTISLVAQCILGTEICLGIIPAGSANGIAVNFNLPQTLPEQIEIALSDCTMNIDALYINDHLCLHIADLGINAELIKNYETFGVRGKLGYFLQSIPTILNSDSPYHFSIETKDGVVEDSGILLAIANANKFGTGATINPSGKMNDGKFEVLIFKNLDFIEIFKTMGDQPDMSSDFVHSISTDNAIIRSTTKIPFQIDGEFIGEINEVTVSVAREKLLVALPEKFCKLHLS